jgi:hypothetical protein
MVGMVTASRLLGRKSVVVVVVVLVGSSYASSNRHGACPIVFGTESCMGSCIFTGNVPCDRGI